MQASGPQRPHERDPGLPCIPAQGGRGPPPVQAEGGFRAASNTIETRSPWLDTLTCVIPFPGECSKGNSLLLTLNQLDLVW